MLTQHEPVQLMLDGTGKIIGVRRKDKREGHPPRVFANGATAYWDTVSLAHVCYPKRRDTHSDDREFCRSKGWWRTGEG